MHKFNSVSISGRLFLFAALMFIVSACSEMKKVDEMKDNTSEMNQTTKTLLNKTGEMKDGLDKMSTATDEMNASTKDLRTLTREELIQRMTEMSRNLSTLADTQKQGDSSGLRRSSLNQLLHDRTLQGRTAEACLYLQSFEYQVLNSPETDKNPLFRELLYQQAMAEFFLKIDELAPKFGKVWPDANPTEDIDSEENRASAFNAIAFGLHKANRQQLPDPAYGRPMSIYDLIVVALAMKPEIDNGRIVLPEGPHFIKEILSRPARVEQILQTRYNMFTYALLGMTTNMSERSKLGQIWKLLFKLDIDLSERARGTAPGQFLYEEVLKPAATTTEDMLNLGIRPELTTTTSLVLSRINVNLHSKGSKTLSEQTTSRENRLNEYWLRYSQPQGDLYVGRRR
jgi:hypothetical protein